MKKQFQSMILLDMSPHIQKSELDSSDDNDEYMESSCNDSNLRVGYASFDEHNEAHPIDEPIKAFFFKHNFMNFPK